MDFIIFIFVNMKRKLFPQWGSAARRRCVVSRSPHDAEVEVPESLVEVTVEVNVEVERADTAVTDVRSCHPVFCDYIPPLVLLQRITVNKAVTLDFADEIRPSVCSICLDKCDVHHREPATLVDCGHSFCGPCLLQWFQYKLECPLCKNLSCHFLQYSLHQTSSDDLLLWDPGSARNEHARPSLSAVSVATDLHTSRFAKSVMPHIKSKADNAESSRDQDLVALANYVSSGADRVVMLAKVTELIEETESALKKLQ